MSWRNACAQVEKYAKVSWYVLAKTQAKLKMSVLYLECKH